MPKCSNKISLPQKVIYTSILNIYPSTKLSEKIFGYELDIYSELLNLGLEYDGIFFHNSDISAAREQRKNISIISHNISLYRIKETHNIKNNKKKIIDENGVIIYYIYLNKKYDDDYFKSLDNILTDIFSAYNYKYTCNSKEIYNILK